MQFRFRPQVLALGHNGDGADPRTGRDDGSGIANLIGDGFVNQRGRAASATLLTLVLEPLVLLPVSGSRGGVAVINTNPVIRDIANGVRGFRRLLGCVFDPRIGVVTFVSLFTVGNGKRAGSAVVVADGVGVNQAAGSSF